MHISVNVTIFGKKAGDFSSFIPRWNSLAILKEVALLGR
jgi:hypothetical protein